MYDHMWCLVALAAVLPAPAKPAPVAGRIDDDGPNEEELPAPARARSLAHDRASGVSARTEAALDGPGGLERLRINVRGLPSRGGTASLVVGEGTEMIELASVLAERSGRVRFRFDTAAGTLHALAGAPFRIRIDGTDVLKGTLPIL